MKRPIRVQHQLLIALVVPALAAIVLVAYLAEVVASRALEEALGERLSSVAASAASLLDARLFVLGPGDDDARPRQNATAKLRRLEEAAGVDRIVVIRLSPPTAIVDTSEELKVGDEYGRADFDRHELDIVRRGERASSFLFQSKDGRLFKTGYAPLRDQESAVLGAVAVHAPASYYDDIDELRRAVVIVAVIGLVVLGLLAAISARTVSVPLARLSRAAKQIGEGKLDTVTPSDGPREIVELAASMETMAASLKAREEELQMMLAGIAHEVRNPLGGIELFGGLLKEDLADDDPRRAHVLKILKELSVLSRVVTDFLEFARRREPVRRDVLVRDLLNEVATVTEKLAMERSVVVRVEASDQDTICVDPEAFRRALLNLVRNAIQAAPKGGRVLISGGRSRLSDDEGEATEMIVDDDGPGVPEDLLASVFRPFFTTKQQGTGLGLALAKKTVEAHGGRIDVETSPWGGARFRIRLRPC